MHLSYEETHHSTLQNEAGFDPTVFAHCKEAYEVMLESPQNAYKK